MRRKKGERKEKRGKGGRKERRKGIKEKHEQEIKVG